MTATHTLLVVDDEPDVVAALRRALRDPRYEVLGCTSPHDALDLLARQRVDVVISDLDMPGMHGMDLLRRIRADYPETVRMVLTGRASLETALDAINQGEVHRYLTKPWDRAALRETIGTSLDRLDEARAAAAASVRVDRRAEILAELERRHPGLTRVALVDGAVVLDPLRLDLAWRLGASTSDGSAPLDGLAGRVLDQRYRLETPIGSGGFGVVYQGVQLSLEREVAVKVLRAHGTAADRMRRFRVEALSTCRVVHPNAVVLLDAGVSDQGLAYLVMELLDGETLAARLRRGETLSFRDAAALGADVCAALAVAHAAGIHHRDIKPANVFLHRGPEGAVTKLLDFGIAKLATPLGSFAELTAEDVVLGTPAYLAPERVLGAAIDGRADVYSVGVLLYDALAGVTPFHGASPDAVLQQQVSMHPRPLSALDPDVPEALDAIVRELLAKEPSRRPAAAEAADRLRALAAALGDGRMRAAATAWASLTTEADL